MAAIRTGGDHPGRRMVFALLAFVPRRRGIARYLEVGAELRPGNGTTFSLESQSDDGQLAEWTLTYIRFKGKWRYLYRAVDSTGATLAGRGS